MHGGRPISGLKAGERPDGRARRPASAAAELPRYQGYGLDAAAWPETSALLAKLALRMSYADAAEANDNEAIPAGYTYFAQLVAHDTLAMAGPLPTGAVTEQHNYRTQPLVLETLYGGGPEMSPTTYEVNRDQTLPRIRFRLGQTRAASGRGASFADLPRAACPFASGAADGLHRDVLIADPRNDDNVLVSQVTTLFMRFHNAVEARLEQRQAPAEGRARRTAAWERFLAARGLVARCYRAMVRDDLLARLLDPAVQAAYGAKTEREQFLDPLVREPMTSGGGLVVPNEFSLAAFRFGHAMVHASYSINEVFVETRLKDMVDQTSFGSPEEMPLAADWVVDWSRFFALGHGGPVNPSRRITPMVAAFLIEGGRFQSDDGLPGGLIYRDLLRAAAVGVRPVATLIETFGLDGPGAPALLADPAARADAIAAWLGRTNNPFHAQWRLGERDIATLAADPPLLFFLLFEAWTLADGRRLGPLGSTLVAEVLYAGLLATAGVDEAAAAADEAVLGRPRLATLPDLVAWVAAAEATDL